MDVAERRARVPHRGRIAGVAVGVLLIGAAVGIAFALAGPGTPRAVTPEEAVDAFQVIADARGAASVCQELADDRSMCEFSFQQAGPAVPLTAEVGRAEVLTDGSVVLHVSGEISTGSASTYEGFVQFVRVGDRVRAVDPVYWLSREFLPSPHGD